MNAQPQAVGQMSPREKMRNPRPIDRPEADIPESQWIVHTNRNRLYLWTYTSEGKRDVELYKRLIREPGIRIEPQSKMLYLDYEMRAKRLRARDPKADISQRALEAPFLYLVKPDIVMYGSEVEKGFENWLASNQGIRLKSTPQIGGPSVRGYFEGDDCVSAQISSYSQQYGGYTCSWVNFKEGNHPQFCNEFNNIGMVKIMDTYQRLQSSGRRSRESMVRAGLQADGMDPVAEATQNTPMFFATNEERMAALAEEERKRQAQAAREAAHIATNIHTIQAHYATLPPLSALPDDHVGLQYLREKKVLDYVRDIPELRGAGLGSVNWVNRVNGTQLRLNIHPGLVLPMVNLDGELRNIQIMFYKNNLDSEQFHPDRPDNTRERRFMSLPTAELLFAFPGGTPGQKDVPIIVVEGFATGASLYAATRAAQNRDGKPVDIPVYVAWNVGNMEKIVPLLHERFPDSPIFIGADNDLRKVHLINTQTGKPYGNPGVDIAEKIRAQLPGTVQVLIPPADGFPKGVNVDFNDVHCQHGLARLTDIINPALNTFGIHAKPPAPASAHIRTTQPTVRDAARQLQMIWADSVLLADLPGIPRPLQEKLQFYNHILRRDMRWLDTADEVLHTHRNGQVRSTKIGQGILLPLRSFDGKAIEMAFYPVEQGLSGKPRHLTGQLNGAYYPLAVSQDKKDTSPVILAEDYMDAWRIKQQLSAPYPTIFVGFHAGNMRNIAERIQTIQPHKHMIVIPSLDNSTSGEITKNGESLGDFCKKSQKTVKLLSPLHDEQSINQAVQEILQMRTLQTQYKPSSYKPS